jgi:hypothetical protein
VREYDYRCGVSHFENRWGQIVISPEGVILIQSNDRGTPSREHVLRSDNHQALVPTSTKMITNGYPSLKEAPHDTRQTYGIPVLGAGTPKFRDRRKAAQDVTFSCIAYLIGLIV